jgi:tetratricopeptide (TPR) repeat protein
MTGAQQRITQRKLLTQSIVEALAADPQSSTHLLVFREDLAAALTTAGHRVTQFPLQGPWPEDGPFDMIVAIGTLEQCEDERALVRHFPQWLKSDGIAIVAVPMATAGREPTQGTLRHYGTNELESVLIRGGLQVVRQLAEGPELLIFETAPSQGTNNKVVAHVAKAIADEQWAEAEEALATLSEQIEDKKLLREYAMLVGHVHLAQNRLGEALDAFKQASKIMENNVLPLTAMGAVALAAQDMEAAADIFRAALEACPTHFSALRGVGIVDEFQGNKEQSLTHFDMACVQRPADREISEKVINLAIELGRADPAYHAIDRHLRATGDESWAAEHRQRVAPLTCQPPSQDASSE